MDREQEEMQFLGLFGVFVEGYKLIISCRKIFSQITLALIIPLSFIYLAHIEVSNILFSRILHTEFELDETRSGTQKHNKLAHLVSSEWTTFWLFKFAYFTFLLIFSLLSTSAVVYTIACVYTAREITFKKVMSVVPKVWKRLMVTFLCTFIAVFAYNVVAVLTIILWYNTIAYTTIGVVSFYIFLALYVVGFVYMTIVWQLASVMSVLEDTYGFKAMVKSKELIKGKMWVAIIFFFMLHFSLAVIERLFGMWVVHGRSLGMLHRVALGIVCLLLLFKLILFGLVIQTVIYFVCKSYHHESIDKSALSDHLEVYLGEYVPLTAKNVQLEEYHV